MSGGNDQTGVYGGNDWLGLYTGVYEGAFGTKNYWII